MLDSAVPETIEHPGIRRVLNAAARKGVTLDVTVFDQSTHTAADAAAALGAELGQIVKSLVFVAPGTDGELEPIVCLVSGREPRRPQPGWPPSPASVTSDARPPARPTS
jgi:hypothetical protein